VNSFDEMVTTRFHNEVNAICWERRLWGDFSEIIRKVKTDENITVIAPDDLRDMELSADGQLAREIILQDFSLLEAHGASPVLNVIKYYEKDESNPFFPTDVYSFHADRSPVETDTFLCTYYGAPSEILPNRQAIKKVLIPEIRNDLKKGFKGQDEDFESFLTENSYDLHYTAKPGAAVISTGIGHLWRLAVEHPGSEVPPCIHRAPVEKPGEHRLLMIC
jgi:hypothetical protein